MGRYYEGDIKGKFWFGVQSSDDASFFGGEEREPSTIKYHFASEDLPDIEEGINKCSETLGEYKAKLNAFFGEGGAGNLGYNDELLERELQVDHWSARNLLEWYARLELGEKIRACVVEQGECNFEAEL